MAPWTRRSVMALLTLLLCTALAHIDVTEHHTEERRPHDVQSAQQLHRHALRVGRINSRAAPSHSSCSSFGIPPASYGINPASFGGDPTGRTDSTDALLKAVAAMDNATARAQRQMASKIVDLGGATIDLGGGTYLISSPLVIPDRRGNYRIRGGTLRASSTFPSGRFLIEVGTQQCVPADGQKVCSEFVGMDNLFLDGSHVALGCLQVALTMGTTFGPSSFCTGYTGIGVRVFQGHETMILDSWLAAYYWSDLPVPKDNQAALAIELNGEDNYLTDVVIFNGGQRGAVLINGAASVLQGVHTWGGNIAINGSYDRQDRILGCYIDYNTLDIVNPRSVEVSSTFFYNGHMQLHGPTAARGLLVKDNTYALQKYGGKSNIILAPGFDIKNCRGVVVEGGINGDGDWRVLSTTARSSLHQATSSFFGGGGHIFAFDFASRLLYPNKIDQVGYSVTFDDGTAIVSHGARPSKGSTVIVELDETFHGGATVTVTVTQCPWFV